MVAESFTTRRSPVSRKRAISLKRASIVSSSAQRLTSSRTSSRARPCASGGSRASREGGSSKSIPPAGADEGFSRVASIVLHLTRRRRQRLGLHPGERRRLVLDQPGEDRRRDFRPGQAGKVHARLGQPVHLRVHVAGVDGVHAYARSLQLGGEREGDVLQRRLAGAVA